MNIINALILLLVVVAGLYFYDKKQYNKGICPMCKQHPLIRDMHTPGEFECANKNCRHTILISGWFRFIESLRGNKI